MTKLSPRAKKLFARIKDGSFYPVYGKRLPKAMAELQKAGLVGACGRVTQIILCFVPRRDYTPFKPERLPGRTRRPKTRQLTDRDLLAGMFNDSHGVG